MKLEIVKKGFVLTVIFLFSSLFVLAQKKSFKDLEFFEIRYDPLKMIGLSSAGVDFQFAYKPKGSSFSPQIGIRPVLNSFLEKEESSLQERRFFEYKSTRGIVLEPGVRLYLGKERETAAWYLSFSYQYKNEIFEDVEGLYRLNTGAVENIKYRKDRVSHGGKVVMGCKIFKMSNAFSHEIEFGLGLKKSVEQNALPVGAVLATDKYRSVTELLLPTVFFLIDREAERYAHGIISLSYRLGFRFGKKQK